MQASLAARTGIVPRRPRAMPLSSSTIPAARSARQPAFLSQGAHVCSLLLARLLPDEPGTVDESLRRSAGD